jgi:predicted secreted Zn-dependent protease
MRVLVLALVALLATLAARVLDTRVSEGHAALAAEAVAESGEADPAGPSGAKVEAEPAGKPVFTIIDVMTYPVEGLSPRDLLASMEANGPDIQGSTYFGLTETQIEFRYSRVDEPGGCSLRDVRVDLGVVVRVPEWEPPEGVSRLLVRDWARFDAALRHHEDGHRVIAEDGAIRVFEALRALRMPTCDGIDEEARRLANAISAGADGEQARYDARTGHGRTQGARWPLR